MLFWKSEVFISCLLLDFFLRERMPAIHLCAYVRTRRVGERNACANRIMQKRINEKSSIEINPM